MEIVYNPPVQEKVSIPQLNLGDLFKIHGSHAVYMKIEQRYSGSYGVTPFGDSVAIGLKDGCFYSFSAQNKVIKLDGKLTVWEV